MNRFDFYLAQLLSESELDGAFDASEQADWDIIGDLGLVGIASGLVATQHAPTADLTIDVTAGVSYDTNGRRVQIGSGQVVDMSVDFDSNSTAVGVGGNSKVVSLFLYAERTLSDPRVDGNSNTVQFSRAEAFAWKVVQGNEATTGTEVPPTLEADKLLVADITIDFGQTQILDADVNSNAVGGNRRQDAFVASAGSLSIREGQPEAATGAVLTELNNHITGVSNSHPASALDYAGGPAWHDGTTNPAVTIEVQLDKIISDLTANAGSDRVGSAALTAWRGGRTRPVGSLFDQIQAVGVDLSAQTASDDGAERVGSEARTGTQYNLALGSVASQLQAISDVTTFAGTNTWEAVQTHEAGLTLNTAAPFPIDSSAVDVVWTVNQNGSLQFKEEGSNDILVDISPGSGSTNLFRVGLSRFEFMGDESTGEERFVYISSYTTTGNSFNGAGLSFQPQAGEGQTGVSDNTHGGDYIFYMAAAGSGGSGATGNIGGLRRFWASAEEIKRAKTFTNISSKTSDFFIYDQADGDVIDVTVTVVAIGATGTRGASVTKQFTMRKTGGTAAFIGSATTLHSQTNTTGTFVLEVTNSPSSDGFEINVDPGTDTLTGTVYVDIRHAF